MAARLNGTITEVFPSEPGSESGLDDGLTEAMKTANIPQLEATGAGGYMRRAHLSIQRCADALFSSRGTTTDQYALLRIVKRWEGIRQNQLATELFADASTVTAMVRLLETRGLIRREVCSDDGRARRVYLTPSGSRLLNQLARDWEPYRDRIRALFAGESGQEALRILDSVRREMVQRRVEIMKKSGRRKRGPAKKPNAA